jgi:hypothetical protein
MKAKSHSCPICGYAKLKETPRSKSGGGSFEICPACGFQFGVSDDDDGISYEEWREDWIERGMEWTSKGIPAPKTWKAETSLAKVTEKAAK